MVKATDGILIELARKAKVRPPHIYHLAAYRVAAKQAFSIEGYAAFAQMDAAHVERMIAVLDELPERQSRKPAGRTTLSEGWQMPEEWVLMGRERRFWPLDVCRTEADKFVNWHRMKGNAFADWKAAWRNWIDGSRRENGNATSDRDEAWTPERMKAYTESLR